MANSARLDSGCLHLSSAVPPNIRRLLENTKSEQQSQGYFDTLREICQQPATLLTTCDCMCNAASALNTILSGARALTLTGSGSSEYAGECVRLALQADLGRTVQTVGSGTILTQGTNAIGAERPALMISLARSGDSPESVGAVSFLLDKDPAIRHLILTCNSKGKLAERFSGDPRVLVIVLDERTNDRSLVMTSSFTSLVVAARFAGLSNSPDTYRSLTLRLSRLLTGLMERHLGTLARIAAIGFERAVFLGSGTRYGSAREAALKMLEMTAGAVSTLPETYLGLRHGPMSYVHDDSLIVCFLSSHPTVRAYETDLIRELNRKQLGLAKVIVGDGIARDLLSDRDFAIECPGLCEVGDENAPVVDVVVGQLLAFFRCLKQGLRPDSPSESGVINRVVESFELHRAEK